MRIEGVITTQQKVAWDPAGYSRLRGLMRRHMDAPSGLEERKKEEMEVSLTGRANIDDVETLGPGGERQNRFSTAIAIEDRRKCQEQKRLTSV